MNECSKCGERLKKKFNYCPYCGKKRTLVDDSIKDEKEEKNYKKTRKSNAKRNKRINSLLWILGFVLPPVGLVLYIMWKKDKEKTSFAKNAGVGALVAACIWAFLGLSLLIDAKGSDKEEEVTYEIYNGDINEWLADTASDEPVITVIGLTYCQYCKNYNPIINSIAEEKGYKLYWFDADAYDSDNFSTLTGTYELSYSGSSPYTLVTKGGEVIGEHVEGYMSESETEEFLSELGL